MATGLQFDKMTNLVSYTTDLLYYGDSHYGLWYDWPRMTSVQLQWHFWTNISVQIGVRQKVRSFFLDRYSPWRSRWMTGSAQLSNKFSACSSWTVSIVLEYHKHISFPLVLKPAFTCSDQSYKASTSHASSKLLIFLTRDTYITIVNAL